MSERNRKLNSADLEYVRAGEEQKERTRRIVMMRADLYCFLSELWKQTEVEEGCWVPRLERMEWIEKNLADTLAKVVSENGGEAL